MKHQSSHNTVNHHRGILSALSFLMVPQMSFGIQDSLRGISLSQLQKSLCQVAGGSNHNLPVHPQGKKGHPENQVHLACLWHQFLDKVPCSLEVTTSPLPGKSRWGEVSCSETAGVSPQARVGASSAVLGTKGSNPHVSSGCWHKQVVRSLQSWWETKLNTLRADQC